MRRAAVGTDQGALGRPAMCGGEVKQGLVPGHSRCVNMIGTLIMTSMNRLSKTTNDRRFRPLSLSRKARVLPAVIKT